ncbi:MAG: CotH kinase family protein [Saprospiraceae bacterium]
MKNMLALIALIIPICSFAQRSANRPLFDKKTIGEIRLTIPQNNWNDLLDSMRIYGKNMLECVVSIDGQTYEQVGVRFRGDKSYQYGQKRNPFVIRLDYRKKDQTHQEYSTIKLSAALRDPSMTREMLFSEIAGKYLPTPQTAYAKLYVNNEYLGVFVNVEDVDKKFLKTHYGGSGGNELFKAGVDHKPEVPGDAACKNNIFGALEYESNPECYKSNFELHSKYENWESLQELTRVLNQDVKKIEDILDVDRVLWMHALNNAMVNLSSYSGMHSVNYYLYRDNHGRFQPILWDMNLAFGSFKNIGQGSDLDLKGLQNLSPLLHADNPLKPLISKLLADPYYKKVYLAHLRQIIDEYFANGWYEKRAQELQGLIVVPYNDDRNKPYSLDEFQRSLRETIGKKSRIPGIVELMSKRVRYLKTHPELTNLAPNVSDITFLERSKFDNKRVTNFQLTARADRFSRRLTIFYRFKDGDPYKPAVMADDASAQDLPAGFKQYAIAIEAPAGEDAEMEYYIVAENSGAASFYPPTYTQKGLKVKLADLNK